MGLDGITNKLNSTDGILDIFNDKLEIHVITEILKTNFNILKPGGYFIFFGGRFFYRIARIAEDVGFEVRDTIARIYSAKVTSELKVCTEFILILRKPTERKLCRKCY